MVDISEFRITVCDTRLNDQETRIRHLEANNKEQAKLYLISDKLGDRITAVEDKIDIRLGAIEQWKESRMATLATEHLDKREGRGDTTPLISLIISLVALTVIILKAVL